MLDTVATSVGEKAKSEIKTAHELISNSRMNWVTYFEKVGFYNSDTKYTDRECNTVHGGWGREGWVECEDMRMVLRSDTLAPLGIVGPSFTDISNRDAFGIADPIIKQGGEFIGCGEYEGGRLSWVQIKMPIDPADVVNGDPVMPYLLIVTGHTGNRSLTYKMTSIRVRCKNTLYTALRGQTKQSGTIRHSGDAKSKCEVASALLDKHRIFFNDTVGIFRSFANAPVNQPTVERYFKTIAKAEPKHYKANEHTGVSELTGRPATMYDRYMTAYHGDRGGASSIRGTLWGAYNAVTYVQDPDMVEEQRRATASKSANDRAAFQYFEASPRVSQEAFDLALEYKAGKHAIASN